MKTKYYRESRWHYLWLLMMLIVCIFYDETLYWILGCIGYSLTAIAYNETREVKK